MTDPRPARGAAHASHDLFVIAAAADRDADPMARSAAEAQMSDCAECAALFADLRSISMGLSALPRELPAPRDFRLTAQRAASLRPRRWRVAFDSLFRSPSLRPFGNVLATIGFAGLVLTVGFPALTHGFAGSGTSATSAPLAAPNGSPGAAFGNVPGAGGAYPAATAGSVSNQGAESTSGKSGPTAAPADNGTGGGAGVAQQSAGPVASPLSVNGAQPSAPSRGATDVATNDQAFGPVAPAPAPDPLSYLPWLSLGTLLVGIGLLVLARIGARARI
jgi:hypothetical protein